MDVSEIKWAGSMADIDRDAWNTLAASAGSPMLLWEYLNLLEETGSVSPGYGWTPCHFTLRRNGVLTAAAPMYQKTSSAGEFVFDYLWAETAERIGKPYYPKLVGMVPLTPCRGYRLLTEPDADVKALTARFLAEIDRLCLSRGLNAASFHFCDPAWASTIPKNRYTAWDHLDFIMQPDMLGDWDGYLRSLSKNGRKNARKEIDSVKARGITLRMVSGRDAPESFYPLMWRYYLDTNLKFGPWAALFLNEEFFMRLKSDFPDNHLFCAAYKDYGVEAAKSGSSGPAPVALSMFLSSDTVLLGRYWGADDFYPNLHFGICYYEPIRWAIENGIRAFDPGMGGDHKARRGFEPRMHPSMHRFFDPLMDGVFRGNIHLFNEQEENQLRELSGGKDRRGTGE